VTRGGFLELHETPSHLQKWVLSFQEIKDWCGSRVIAFLNSSRERRSVSFPKVEQMTGWEMEARNTKRKGAVEVVTFMASLFGRILIDLGYIVYRNRAEKISDIQKTLKMFRQPVYSS